MVDRQAGAAYIEAIIALAVLGIVASFAFTGDRGQLRHVAQAFAETKARHLAAARLETLKADPAPPVVGERAFDLDPRHVDGLPRAVGTERVRVVEPGLLEVAVTVEWGAPRRREVALTTWMEAW